MNSACYFRLIMKFSTLNLFALISAAAALSPAEWRSQSIYQVLTDRFARTDGSTTATCDTGDGIYCGGSWQGIIDKLDYIQDMGFTAVRTFLSIFEDLKLMRLDLDLSYCGKSSWEQRRWRGISWILGSEHQRSQ